MLQKYVDIMHITNSILEMSQRTEKFDSNY